MEETPIFERQQHSREVGLEQSTIVKQSDLLQDLIVLITLWFGDPGQDILKKSKQTIFKGVAILQTVYFLLQSNRVHISNAAQVKVLVFPGPEMCFTNRATFRHRWIFSDFIHPFLYLGREHGTSQQDGNRKSQDL